MECIKVIIIIIAMMKRKKNNNENIGLDPNVYIWYFFITKNRKKSITLTIFRYEIEERINIYKHDLNK